MTRTRNAWNGSRYQPAQQAGFYESWFQRANHPTRPLAFWIRYTVLQREGRPEDACGELWAIYFDGENQRITAAKEVVPLAHCSFARTGLAVQIGGATLTEGELHGGAASAAHALSWSLRYTGDEPPLLLFPEALYDGAFPKAKVLVGTPQAEYAGTLVVDGVRIGIDGWRGSQNHNWGSRHTDRYAWGQVAGFDDAPDAFLECATAQIRLGPFWTPRATVIVLREHGEELAFNGVLQALRTTAHYEFFSWQFDARSPRARIHGRIHAPASAFVGLEYLNPPGGSKTCLNTKLASAEITVERPGQAARILTTRHRAAFEILTDRTDHGVPVVP